MLLTVKQAEFEKQLDLTLIRNFRKSGDIEILSQVYQKYMPLIYGIGLKYLKSKAMANRLVIQVFEKTTIELIKHETRNFKSWLYIIAKNQCSSILKNHITDNGEESVSETLNNEYYLHPIDNEQQNTNAIKQCIEKLNSDQKLCIDQFYFKHKCYKEIALSLKLDEAIVKTHIKLGKKNLKICLASSHVKL